MASRPGNRSEDQIANKWRPAVGPDYDIEDHVTIEARTRSWIAKVFVGSGLIALAVAGVVSLVTGKMTLVLAVWGVTGPLFGAITGYYFRIDRKDSG
jgi:hypothetical protein